MRGFIACLALMVSAGSTLAENWPQWRGPRGNGVSTETGLPVKWGDEENVAWKAQLSGLSVSTPIIYGDRVFVTSQAGRGVLREGNHPTLMRGEETPSERSLGEVASGAAAAGDVVFLVEAFDRKDGRRLWEYRVPAETLGGGDLPPVHRKHNLASPSPVTDGERVYAWFGTGQLAALDLEGKLVWQKNLAKDYAPFEIPWGHSSSPTVYEDDLLLLCDHEPASYLVALDKRTGQEKWKTDRGKGLRSYSTPTVVSGPAGDELVVNSSEKLEGYDPKTGKLLWFLVEPNQFPIPVPSFADGIIYTSRGYRSGPLWRSARERGEISRGPSTSFGTCPRELPTSPPWSTIGVWSTWRATPGWCRRSTRRRARGFIRAGPEAFSLRRRSRATGRSTS